MDTVLATLNDTLSDTRNSVKTHEAVVEEARKCVINTKAELDDAQKKLTKLIADEAAKTKEHDEWRIFCNGEPNRGTSSMQAKLERLSNEANTLVVQLAPARQRVDECQKKYASAVAVLRSDEQRLEKIDQEYSHIAERIRQLAKA